MKVPKPRRLKSGNYNIQLHIGGRYESITRPTARECARAAALLKSEHRAGVRRKAAEGENLPLRAAIDEYIDSRDKTLSPTTIRGYRKIRDLRFQGAIGKPLKSINWQRECNAETVSAKTLKNSWGFIKSVLRYHGMPIPNVTLPQVVAKDLPWIEPDDLPKFLKAIEGDLCEADILLALHGLRKSELLAVGKIENGYICVDGAVVIGEGGMVRKPETKNASSRRFVPVMIPRLAELAKDGPIKHHYYNTVYCHINSACESCGLPKVGVHGLRRSFASLCYHLGISELQAAKWGGWSDLGTMRKIYTKLARRDADENRAKVIDFFQNDERNDERKPQHAENTGILRFA